MSNSENGFVLSLGGVRLKALNSLFREPQKSQKRNAAIGAIRIGRGNLITHRKPSPLPFCLEDVLNITVFYKQIMPQSI
jgi:hypothetical protein